MAIAAALSGCTNNNSSQNSTSSSTSSSTESSSSSSESSESIPDSSAPESPATESSNTEGTSGNMTGNGILADLTGTLTDVSKVFECSDGWTNGSMFNCTWRKRNVEFSDGSMKLKIDTDGNGMGPIPYSGAEFRSKDFYGFGMYEVVMKPIKNDGVVSSFFTYTGPSDNNPWDEIDIEFLGKDTTKVQFNYYTDGKGNHEYLYDLGFDASEDFHTYGFDWQEDKITWYVDGAAVYTADKNIPSTPSKIMMNVWPGTGVDGWLNAFDGTTPLTAEYKSADFREGGAE
ncbi:MAG: family 16 glycosylhydrolase [Ruminococcaceae bacterium]|nr:family 16 glycosylhydrolase [Oscillospiraceae bacterium]